MITTHQRSRYLRAIAGSCAALSLVLVVWPAGGARAFSMLVYGDAQYPADFSPEALAYIRLVHAVLGSVMFGWFLTVFLLAPLAATSSAVRRALACGLVAWYVPDTAYSWLSGFWPNAVLNTVVAAPFVPALAALRPTRAGA